MTVSHGWLLDLYADGPATTLWVLSESGQRLQLSHTRLVDGYVAGDSAELRQLWRFLRSHPTRPDLGRDRRRDLFAGMVDVLRIRTTPAAQPALMRDVARRFPHLTIYDSDIPLGLRYAAQCIFPLAFCAWEYDDLGRVQTITPLDSPWQQERSEPPLRIMCLTPNVDPAHAPPTELHLSFANKQIRWPLNQPRLLLIHLNALLQREDPDLLLTDFGDTWLLPWLLAQAERKGMPSLMLNRDATRAPLLKQASSYHTYGQVVFRGRQVHLAGRWHIDTKNAMLYADYGLVGSLEQARVTGLPVQEIARKSPGAGVTALQIMTALRDGVLVPTQKQQAEQPKTAYQLLQADRGGLVYQPLIGLHRDTAEIDFVSMYPSIMVHFNVSPETVGPEKPGARPIPELDGMWVSQTQEGLVPRTLRPLLAYRIALKQQLATLTTHDCRRPALKARAAALKWLLVVCFGYLGYKNARFGRIEAHEAVTAYGREALLRAKEAAEDAGFRVLHMYVDGLWVQRKGVGEADARQLMAAVTERTGLPIALEGIYRWVAFLPSRQDERVPVANRYFGVFRRGDIKTRGIAVRRRDTPPFVGQLQLDLLRLLASVPDGQPLERARPQALRLVQTRVEQLRLGRVPLQQLLVRQRLSRDVEAYRVPSPAARAAQQLVRAGKPRHPGQSIRFLYVLGSEGVYAWDMPGAPPAASCVDVAAYETLMLRASAEVLTVVGIGEDALAAFVMGIWQLGFSL